MLRVIRHWMNQACASSASTTRTRSRSRSGSGSSARSTTRRPTSCSSPRRSRAPRCSARSRPRGFQQSYTYFTWRNTKGELEEFLASLADETADFLRPNLFVNTPDILTEYLQFGGPAAFTVRATVAATAAPTWGVYSGFELFESVARPGAEEYIDNEKYEYKPRDFAAAEREGRSLALYLGILNSIRREHPALGQLRNLHLHRTDDDSVIAYSKHLEQAFTGTGATTRSSSSRTSTRTPCARPPCISTSRRSV